MTLLIIIILQIEHGFFSFTQLFVTKSVMRTLLPALPHKQCYLLRFYFAMAAELLLRFKPGPVDSHKVASRGSANQFSCSNVQEI
jgi:hypothetical protein